MESRDSLGLEGYSLDYIIGKHRFCNVRWCIANHFFCSCVCDIDHESAKNIIINIFSADNAKITELSFGDDVFF